MFICIAHRFLDDSMTFQFINSKVDNSQPFLIIIIMNGSSHRLFLYLESQYFRFDYHHLYIQIPHICLWWMQWMKKTVFTSFSKRISNRTRTHNQPSCLYLRLSFIDKWIVVLTNAHSSKPIQSKYIVRICRQIEIFFLPKIIQFVCCAFEKEGDGKKVDV